MIVDYDDDNLNDGWQSDIVSIALNLAFVKDFDTLKKLVAFGNKGGMKGEGLILTPTYKTMDDVPQYSLMEDPDLEEKKRIAKEKKEKVAKKKAKKAKEQHAMLSKTLWL